MSFHVSVALKWPCLRCSVGQMAMRSNGKIWFRTWHVTLSSGPVQRKSWEGQLTINIWQLAEDQLRSKELDGPVLGGPPYHGTTPPHQTPSAQVIWFLTTTHLFIGQCSKSSNTVWGHPIRFPFWCFNHKHLNMLYSDNIRLCVK